MFNEKLADFCYFMVSFKKHDSVSIDSVNMRTHIIERKDIEKLKQAYLELHYDPGINFANKRTTAIVYEISVAALYRAGPYWWTTPGLKGNYDPKGVVLYEGDRLSAQLLWRHPEYQKALDHEEQDMLKQERDG